MVRVKSIPKRRLLKKMIVYIRYEVKNPTVFEISNAQDLVLHNAIAFGVVCVPLEADGFTRMMKVLLKIRGHPERIMHWLSSRLPNVSFQLIDAGEAFELYVDYTMFSTIALKGSFL